MAKKRYCLYLSRPLAHQLERVASLRHGSKSALLEEALRKSLEPEQVPGVEEGLVRRLNELHKAWSELVTAEEDPPRTRERVRARGRSKTQPEPDRHSDLPLFAEHGPEPERDMAPDEGPPLGDDNVIDFPGARF